MNPSYDVPERTLPPEPRCVANCWCCQNDILQGETYYEPSFKASGGKRITMHICEQCMEDSKTCEEREED